MNKMIKTILFDWDGTLAQSLPVWHTIISAELQKNGIELDSHLLAHTVFGVQRNQAGEALNFPNWEGLMRKVYKKIANVFPTISLYSGVHETLSNLSDYRKVVVTSTPCELVMPAIDAHGIGQFFEFVLGSDDVKRSKPDPEVINIALKRLNIPSSEAIIVGDSDKDIIAGKAAGIKTVLFTPDQHREFYDFTVLRAAKPDFEIHEISQLAGVI
jgi:HAD superfamily hydrolase (TIGR01549 family)